MKHRLVVVLLLGGTLAFAAGIGLSFLGTRLDIDFPAWLYALTGVIIAFLVDIIVPRSC